MHSHFLLTFRILLVATGICLSLLSGQTQNTRITGIVIDSSSVPMVSATVVLVQPQDSVMVAYSLTNDKGRFVLNGIPDGSYHLQITYIGYGHFQQSLTLDGSEGVRDLGIIFLSSQNSLLEEVVVRAEHVPIAFNKDTLEYNAAAFKTQPNAPVEDLLKKLPGVTVNRDGSIRAQGQDVDNVLVDGKSFFGDDATIATKNLPADIVDKVQVFDKTSDLASFSGVDDGNEEKTINLSLKEDKKNGYFGSLEAGLGHDDPTNDFDANRFRSKANLHRFDRQLQFSALGMANNNNDPGFSFNDYINFMGGMGNFLRGGGAGFSFDQSAVGVPIGMNNTPGITKTYAGGINFNFNPNKKFDWQSSYFINRISNQIQGFNSSQNLGDLQDFLKRDSSVRDNTNLNHRLNTALKYESDSTFQLIWNNRLAYHSGDVQSSLRGLSFDPGSDIENHTESTYLDDGSQFNWNSQLTLRKRLGKPGRLLSGNFEHNWTNNTLNAIIANSLILFENETIQANESNNQEQLSDQGTLSYTMGLTYTEPIGRRTFLNLNANRTTDEDERDRQYFEIDPLDPSSRVLNQNLSNNFNVAFKYDRIGTGVRYVGEKLKVSVGLDYQSADLLGQNESDNSGTNSAFNRWLPRARIDYETGNNRNFDLNYYTRLRAPTLDQLQPIIDNTNPVYLLEGNPDLEPEYIHRLNLSYMLFDEFSFTNLFISMRGRYIENSIVNQTYTDSTFRQVLSPVNMDHNYGGNLFFNFETPLKFIRSKIALDGYVDYGRGKFAINGLENTTDRWTQNLTLTLENRKKEMFDLAVGVSLGASRVRYSENAGFDQRYFDQRYFTDLTVNLPGHWTMASTMDFTIYSGEQFGAADQLLLWHTTISKSFLEAQRATLTLHAFDLLNQNQGIERSNNLNYVEERRSNVLGRYLMLSFTYKLSRFGNDNGFHVDVN